MANRAPPHPLDTPSDQSPWTLAEAESPTDLPRDQHAYRCTFEGCPKAFPSEDYLNGHLLEKHGQVRARRPRHGQAHEQLEQQEREQAIRSEPGFHQCWAPGCGKWFWETGTAAQHMLDEHNIVSWCGCSSCDVEFKTPAELKEHMADAHNDTHHCELCWYSDTKRNHVARHMWLDHEKNYCRCPWTSIFGEKFCAWEKKDDDEDLPDLVRETALVDHINSKHGGAWCKLDFGDDPPSDAEGSGGEEEYKKAMDAGWVAVQGAKGKAK